MKKLLVPKRTSKQLISQTFTATNRNMHRMMRKTQLPTLQLSAQQNAIVKAVEKGNFLLRPALVSRHFEERPIPLQKLYEAVFAGAIKALKSNNYRVALNVLNQLGHEWLDNSQSGIPTAMGNKAIALSRAISSNWVAAHASDYADVPIKAKAFAREGVNIRGEKVDWSSKAVKSLAEFGTFKDLAAIRKIEKNCEEGAMELYCADAKRKIITRSALQFSLSGIKNLSSIGIKTRLNKQQVIHHLEVLFDKIGLSSAIQILPGFRVVGTTNVNYVASELQTIDLRKLAEQRSNTTVELDPGSSACEQFLLEQNMIIPQNAKRMLPGKPGEEQKPRLHPIKYVLTDKGKAIVGNLCSKIGQINLKSG